MQHSTCAKKKKNIEKMKKEKRKKERRSNGTEK